MRFGDAERVSRTAFDFLWSDHEDAIGATTGAILWPGDTKPDDATSHTYLNEFVCWREF